MYLEAGVVDVAAETGDTALLASSIARWEDMAATKTYLTGGNGSRHSDEAFGDRYELPPDRAYNETCAAIASFHWSWRLLLATGQARYADLMERVLYNAFGASISTDGQRFFYVNPLQRRTTTSRATTRDGGTSGSPAPAARRTSCGCSPPSSITSPTTDDDTLYLQQYTGAEIAAPLASGTLAIAVSAGLPWSGEVTVRVDRGPRPAPCGLAIRVPAVVQRAAPADQRRSRRRRRARTGGYLLVHRQWQAGDVLVLDVRRGTAVGVPASAHRRGPRRAPPSSAARSSTASSRPISEGAELDDLALLGGTPLTDRPADAARDRPDGRSWTSARRRLGARSPEGLPYYGATAGGVCRRAGRCPAGHGDRGALLPVGQPGRACMRVWLPVRRRPALGRCGMRPGSP